MYKGNSIAVVVPAYNEEQFVGEVIQTVPEFVDRVYPVDDCSTDETWERIKQAARRKNATRAPAVAVADGGQTQRVLPLRHADNRGVGGAIKTGYRRALADDVDVVAVMNGDGQMDPAILDRILDPVVAGDAEYAKGNRLLGPDHTADMSRFRLVGNAILTVLTRIASGYWQLTDPQNGYTAISAHALSELDLDALCDQYGFLNDVLVRLNVHDMSVADVEMKAVYGEETSSIRLSRFVPRLSWLLVRNFLWRLTTRSAAGDRHIAIPYLAGLAGSFGGAVVLAGSVVGLDLGATPGQAVLVLVGCLLLVALGIVQEWRQTETLDATVQG